MPFVALLGGIFLAILGLQGSFVIWLTEHALIVGIVLLIIWVLYSISTIRNLISITENYVVSWVCGALHSILPVFVVLSGYQYLLRYLAESIENSGSTWGAIGTFFEIAVVGGIYLLAENGWYKFVIKNCASSFGTIGFTILHVAISAFFIFAFLTT